MRDEDKPRDADDAETVQFAERGEVQEPTVESAEDLETESSTKDGTRLRRIADALFWRAFTQSREK